MDAVITGLNGKRIPLRTSQPSLVGSAREREGSLRLNDQNRGSGSKRWTKHQGQNKLRIPVANYNTARSKTEVKGASADSGAVMSATQATA